MNKLAHKKYLPSSEYFEIDEFPFYWIARLNARYGLEMDKTLKKLNMDLSRWRVAMLLHLHCELSISEIAEHAIGKMPTITKIVYRMRNEGLVMVAPSPDDGRVALVRLTEHGLANVEQVLEQTQALFDRAFKGMSEAQLKKSTELMRLLFHNLSSD